MMMQAMPKRLHLLRNGMVSNPVEAVMIKVLLWDIDGTILDFLASEKAAIKKCFEIFELGTCTDEMVGEYSEINCRYWRMLERGEMTKPEILVGRFEEFFEKKGIDVSVAPAFNEEYQVRLGDTICYKPGGREIVDYYKGKLLQCAVTNGTVVAQRKKLTNSGLDKIFDHIFISEEVGYEKPSLLLSSINPLIFFFCSIFYNNIPKIIKWRLSKGFIP